MSEMSSTQTLHLLEEGDIFCIMMYNDEENVTEQGVFVVSEICEKEAAGYLSIATPTLYKDEEDFIDLTPIPPEYNEFLPEGHDYDAMPIYMLVKTDGTIITPLEVGGSLYLGLNHDV